MVIAVVKTAARLIWVNLRLRAAHLRRRHAYWPACR